MDIEHLNFAIFKSIYHYKLQNLSANTAHYLENLAAIRTDINKYKEAKNPDQAEQIKLDAMAATLTLMIDFCKAILKKKLSMHEIDVNKLKDLLEVYLKYPHENVGSLHELFLTFSCARRLKTARVLLDFQLFDMNEIKKQILESRIVLTDAINVNKKLRIAKMDIIVLHSQLYFLYNQFFHSWILKLLGYQDNVILFDIKASSVLKDLRTDAMKTDFPESIESYEDAVNVATLLLDTNRKLFEKEGVENYFTVKPEVPFLEDTMTRVYKPSMLTALSYTYLPYYAANSKMKRKLAKHAYGLWLEYHKNLPVNAHLIEKIETLKYMDLALDFTLISDDESITSPSTASAPYEALKKTFKVKIELLTLIKNNKLENEYFKNYYRICKMFQSLIGITTDPEIAQVCEMFAELIKTNKRAAILFKSETGKEFEESKVTIEELIKMMSEAKSNVFGFIQKTCAICTLPIIN